MRTGVLLMCLLALPATSDALEVFACEPEWGALVTELAGELVQVHVATSAFQDPHRVEARPSLISSMRRADLLVCTGADLEAGWLPLLLRRAGNPRIQPGTPGHFLAAGFVRRIEVPTRLDRSQGDIHPQGNPHIHLNPHNITRVAEALGERLVELDPGRAQEYRSRRDDFLARWREQITGWESRGEALAGMRVVAHHRSFSYLADWLRLDVIATLEPKPGVPPGGAYLARLLEQLSATPPAAVIRSPYDNERPSQWLSERLSIPALVLPYTVGGAEGVNDLGDLFDVTLADLEQASR